MKQLIKMKQMFNNRAYVLTVLFFAVAFIFVGYKTIEATMIAVMEMNGGGGGGGTTTTTTTSGTTVNTGAITLNVVPDSNQPYTGSKPITLSSSASVAVCSNTALNLKVTANVTGPGNYSSSWGTLLDKATVGGTTVANNSTFTAPTQSGDYTINLTATRYDPAGYVLTDNYGNALTYRTDMTVLDDNGSTFYVDTNYRGRITRVAYTSGGSNSGEFLIYYAENPHDQDGFELASSLIGEEAIKTYTSSINFTVGKPEAFINKESVQAIPYGTSDNVEWWQKYSNHCYCYTDAAYTKRCKGINANGAEYEVPGGLTGSFTTTRLQSSTTYYIKCDNLP